MYGNSRLLQSDQSRTSLPHTLAHTHVTHFNPRSPAHLSTALQNYNFTQPTSQNCVTIGSKVQHEILFFAYVS